MRKQYTYLFFIALIVVIPVIGYGIMHLLAFLIPMTEQSIGGHVLFTVILIVLGLAVPYWMLRLLFHAAHIKNPQEEEMHMSDIPKDKDQLAKKFRRG